MKFFYWLVPFPIIGFHLIINHFLGEHQIAGTMLLAINVICAGFYYGLLAALPFLRKHYPHQIGFAFLGIGMVKMLALVGLVLVLKQRGFVQQNLAVIFGLAIPYFLFLAVEMRLSLKELNR